MRGIVLTAVLISFAASAAWSQETVSTASPADAHPPGADAAPGPIRGTADHVRTEDVVMDAGPCGPAVSASDDPSTPPDTHPHGEVSVGVGTGGYREIAGSVCKPLANGGVISISAGQEQDQQHWGRR